MFNDFDAYVVPETGEMFLSACCCPRCGRVTSELYQMRCPCGTIFDEVPLKTGELLVLTSRWN